MNVEMFEDHGSNRDACDADAWPNDDRTDADAVRNAFRRCRRRMSRRAR